MSPQLQYSTPTPPEAELAAEIALAMLEAGHAAAPKGANHRSALVTMAAIIGMINYVDSRLPRFKEAVIATLLHEQGLSQPRH